MSLDPKIATFLTSLSRGKEVAELLNSPAVKSILSELTASLSTVSAEVKKEQPKESTVPSDSLLKAYEKLIYKSFRHSRKGTVYTLLDITNSHTQDHENFPVMVTYVDSESRKWTRSLISFNKSFVQV